MNENNIPHCPFCAGDAAIQIDGAKYEIKYVYCECKSCGSRGKGVAFGFVGKDFEKAKKEAIEHWSMRKPLDNIAERLHELALMHESSANDYERGKGFAYFNSGLIVKKEGGNNEQL